MIPKARSRKEALAWLRCVDVYELTELPPVNALETAKALIEMMKTYRLPTRRDYHLVLESVREAYRLGNHGNCKVPLLAIPNNDQRSERP